MDFINKHSKLFQWLLLLLTFFGLIFAIDIPEGYKFIRAEAEHIVVEGQSISIQLTSSGMQSCADDA